MSQYQNGRTMDQPSGVGGSVRAARERAQAGLPRGPIPGTNQQTISPPGVPYQQGGSPVGGQQRVPKNKAPAGFTKDGAGMTISRPTQVPQWPLAGPLSSPPSADSEPYRPPPGRSQPPQRPPRPSHVPSILDGSKVQDHTPVFQYTPQSARASELSVPETPATSSSRPSTLSSVGSIPDFPLPIQAPVPPPPPAPAQMPAPRRSMNLGPPPSSRRGLSSFYSTASFVSPIPEESPKTRSHTSYASSAAMPESWGTNSPGMSPDDPDFDDAIQEEMGYGEEGDESRLVRSASIGRKGKPSIVTTRSVEKADVPQMRPGPDLIQNGEAFRTGTGYVDNSSSSGTLPSTKTPGTVMVTADAMLDAFGAASANDPSALRNATPSPRPPFNRLSALRRPPPLNIDAVRQAEARGSLTSLPDLIRRATRLAAMMERGKRPASRFDELDFPEDVYARDEKNFSYDTEKHQSGMSDLLAAFPPPAQARDRQSRPLSSWPLPLGSRRSFLRGPSPVMEEPTMASNVTSPEPKKRRRCCGLPLWAFILVLIALLILIAAAIVIPLQFFVFRRQNTGTAQSQPALSQCQNQLTCANGGTNVVSQGVCSCICSNGFTGTDCTIPTSQGCTTTSLTSSGNNINNITIGQAIPRLIQQAQTNFSIPLSGEAIVAKFNTANLSCNAENALVTFGGQTSRIVDDGSGVVNNVAAPAGGDVFRAEVQPSASVFVTVLPDSAVTLTVSNPFFSTTLTFSTVVPPSATVTLTTITLPDSPPTTTTTTTTTPKPATTISPSPTTPLLTTRTTQTPAATNTFTVTDEALDFGRVAVLFVLQQEALTDAVAAQTALQRFFSMASSSKTTVPMSQARNVTLGGKNSINLINFLVDVGDGKPIGRGS